MGCNSNRGVREWRLNIVSEDGEAMFRNNGFIMKKFINFCPMCGRDLKVRSRSHGL